VLVYVSSDADNALGENIIKIPFLNGLRDAYPDAHIAWAGGIGPLLFEGPLRPLAEGLIDECLNLEISDRVTAPLRNPLPDRHFDLIIDTQHLPQRALALRRISHGVLISRAWCFAFSDRRPAPEHPRSPHLATRLLDLLSAALGRSAAASHLARLAPRWHAAAAELLPGSGAYVGIAPGAGQRQKCWPLERFVALARDQLAKGRVPVMLLGDAEADWVAPLRAALPKAVFPGHRASFPNAPAGPALTVAIAGRLAAGVANCSGAGHMLAAGGAPLVSLFGPTSPAKFAPYTPDLRILRAQSYGAGNAMEQIPLAAVIAAVDATVSRWAYRLDSVSAAPVAAASV